MANNFDGDIPEDIVREILLRLPVKLLLQYTSVCKTWLSIITSPDFISSHTHRALMVSRIDPTLLAIRVNELILFSRARDGLTSNNNHSNNLLVMPRLFGIKPFVINSCNGIICVANLVNHNDLFYLWNPAIRKCRKLPDPPRRRSYRYIIGFGYDSISADYKVVRCEYDYSRYFKARKVHVYSTNADCWREIRPTIPLEYSSWIPLEYRGWRSKRADIVVNGVVYFDNFDELISFDLHKEIFGRIPLPSSHRLQLSKVLDFEGAVAMVFGYIGDEVGAHLWTLDDVSGRVTWTKIFSIDADPDSYLWLKCYLGGGQFCGRITNKKTDDVYNILYNYEKKKTKLYRNDLDDSTVLTGMIHTETLVSLGGFEQVE
ncbi:F-box protein CPR1-like [Daucus carota subsp. sativus]|uniref:F-box protein CPR1-like n=1 Tax=Daucus carota subsp. sativus TaxID=79200 RepID=UPI0007EF99DB|nr:PREDICTED: F-box protein CPR30-like [Daucus carota subsp. sativus]